MAPKRMQTWSAQQPGRIQISKSCIQYTNRQIPRHVHSKVHVVTPRGPCWSSCRSTVRVFCRDAFDVLERELPLEFGLERGQGTDQLGTSLLKGSSCSDRSIRLNFYQKIWMEWVRGLVASEKNLWHGKELAKKNATLVRAAKAELNGPTRGSSSQACGLASQLLWSPRWEFSCPQ